MTLRHAIGATRDYAKRNVDHLDGNHSGILTRCFCGGPLDRAGADLVYCDWCGREYLASQLRSAHHYHLTAIP